MASFLSLSAFKILSLPLTFDNLIIIFFDDDLLMFNLFGVLWDLQIWVFIFFFRSAKFSATIYFKVSVLSLFICSFWNFHNCYSFVQESNFKNHHFRTKKNKFQGLRKEFIRLQEHSYSLLKFRIFTKMEIKNMDLGMHPIVCACVSYSEFNYHNL